MLFWDWLKPGIRIKRWILMGILGVTIFALGISKMLFRAPGLESTYLLPSSTSVIIVPPEENKMVELELYPSMLYA